MLRPWTRVLLGILLGALFPLILHPTSRPFYQFIPSSKSYEAPQLAGYTGPVQDPPFPKSLEDAGVWAEILAMRVRQNVPVSKDELKTALAVFQAAEKKDTENAFWFQMQACTYWQMHQPKDALDAWRKGANSLRWNDLQSRLIEHAVEKMVEDTGNRQSWQIAKGYYGRSTAGVDWIQAYARKVVENVYPSEKETLQARLYTLRNGKLIVDFCRRVEIGLGGASICEIASQPSSPTISINKKVMIVSRNEFFTRLQEAGLKEDSTRAQDAYRGVDAWRALFADPALETQVKWQFVESAVIAMLPASLLLGSLIGLLLYLISNRLFKDEGWRHWVEKPLILFLGPLLGGGCYLLTYLLGPSLAVGASIVFMIVGPKNVRTKPPRELGLAHSLAMLLMAFFFLGMVSLYILNVSPAIVHVFPQIGVSAEVLGTPSFAAIAMIDCSLICLLSPFFASTQRVKTSQAFTISLSQFGWNAFLVGLFLSVISGPICIFLDRNLQKNLSQIASNEPLYLNNIPR